MFKLIGKIFKFNNKMFKLIGKMFKFNKKMFKLIGKMFKLTEKWYKLKVVQFAKSTNNCAASRKFDVNEKLIRDWKKCEDSMKSMPSKRCAMRRGISY